jgi:hypothetical protein
MRYFGMVLGLIGLFVLLTLTGCGTKEPMVYLSGWSYDATAKLHHPLLWTGMSYTQLPQIQDTCDGFGNAVAVYGNITYVAGESDQCQLNVALPFAVLWTNGKLQQLPLPQGMVQSIGYDVAVSSSGDVYVAGAVSPATPSPTWSPVYWHNGSATVLPMPASWTNGTATGVAVSGNSLYVAGLAENPAQELMPALWTNNAFTPLPLPDGDQAFLGTYKVRIVGTDVYVFGQLVLSDDSSQKAVYWKNGQLVSLDPLDDATHLGWAQDGYVDETSGNMVVSVGSEFSYATGLPDPSRWTGQTVATLSMKDATLWGGATGVAWVDGVEYVSGNTNYMYPPGSNVVYNTACYWVDGVRIDLPGPLLNGDPNLMSGYASGIAVSLQ